MPRPLVGITAALESADWTLWRGIEANISPRTYSLGVADSGGIPVLLPADDATADDPDDLLDVLDALLIAGGADLDPASYGAEAHELTSGYNAERDRFELALAHRAIERDMPVLGICRGMQLLNVAMGGDVDQDVPGREIHNERPGEFSEHDVRLKPGSLAARTLGDETVRVRSHHHQGVGRPGEGIVISGRSEPDGLAEALELPRKRFVLGLLWHPEEQRHAAALTALTAAAKQREVA